MRSKKIQVLVRKLLFDCTCAGPSVIPEKTPWKTKIPYPPAPQKTSKT